MEDPITSVMRMDGDLELFIEQHANSFVKWEAINYFHSHPGERIPFDDVVRILNRPSKPLKRELQELSGAGLLHEEKAGRKTLFAYEPETVSAELRHTMERFIALCQDREGRLRVIYKLLKDGKPIAS
ncbi:MAG: hypothetical protein AB1439_02535 [candidate division FCPU426 bacterium]